MLLAHTLHVCGVYRHMHCMEQEILPCIWPYECVSVFILNKTKKALLQCSGCHQVLLIYHEIIAMVRC